ncbi:hypothetical protein C8F04DRAFT_1101637 [Mycena alexandri]|uniref:FAR-17a/AIG1-like protein n=1 Tax=Mycena alexandri TaxID=1745969 RepID=A0AAD6SVU7_9AGAR|nr:hypothetical protein C8F04DRAFT_1101637 [Mycena alexandri]
MALLSWHRMGVQSTFDPQYKFVSSPVVSPAVLAVIRLVLALYALCTITTILGFDVAEGDGKSFLSYFTELSYIGLTSYYWAAAVQTLFYARYGRYLLRRWPRPLQALHVLLQSTITTFPFIVTVVYWALLSSPQTFATRLSSWQNISIHAMNSAFALLDILLSNAPPAPWLMLPIHIVLLGAYLGVAYITHATQGFYTYSFLNPSKEHGLLAAYIVGIGVGEAVVFVLARTVALLRQRLAIRRGILLADDAEAGNSKDGTGAGEAIDEWEEIERPIQGGGGRGKEGGPVRIIDSGVTVGEGETETV